MALRDLSSNTAGTAHELFPVMDDALRFRYFPKSGNKSLRRHSSEIQEDGLPELKKFRRRWGLIFPIPPCLNSVIEESMENDLSTPVKILSVKIGSVGPERVTMILSPAAGREICLAFVEGVLGHLNPKRRQGTTMRWRTVSRKSRAKDTVQVEKLADGRLKIAVDLPSNKSTVRKIVGSYLERSKTGFRSRADYEQVFRIVDLRKQKKTRRQIQTLVPGLNSPEHVRDREQVFRALRSIFGLP